MTDTHKNGAGARDTALLSPLPLLIGAAGALFAWMLARRPGLPPKAAHNAPSTADRQPAEKRLEFLRAQLQPHFLFNVLHSISALQILDPPKAQKMTILLGDFLRAVLRFPETEQITVEEEVSYLRCYLAIEEVRFEHMLDIELHLDPDVLGAQLPPLILQPLVENAIRYTIETLQRNGKIKITVDHQDQWLILEVQDNGPGPQKTESKSSISKGFGIGLSNIRSRLQELYPNDSTFTLEHAPGGGALARVILPYTLAEEWHERENEFAVQEDSHSRC